MILTRMIHCSNRTEVRYFQHPLGRSYTIHIQRIDQNRMSMVHICHIYRRSHEVDRYILQCPFHRVIFADSHMVYSPEIRNNLSKAFIY